MAVDDTTVRTASGRTLAYAETGEPDGAPVFYFHGIPGSRLDFHQPFNRPALDGAGVRIIGIDRPGYGGSDFQRRRRYTDCSRRRGDRGRRPRNRPLRHRRLFGRRSLRRRVRHRTPHRVTSVGVVSGDGPAEMPNFRDGMGKTDALMIRIARWASPVGRLAINQARRQAERAPEKFSGQFDKELSPPDVAVHREAGMREAVRVAFLESTRHGARGIIEDYRIWSAPTGLDYTKVHCPARLWHGDADAVVPVHHASYVAALIPDAELEVMPGVGHLHTAARWHDFVTAVATAGE